MSVETITLGRKAGLTLLHRAEAPSVQRENAANGVTWTWLVFAGS